MGERWVDTEKQTDGDTKTERERRSRKVIIVPFPLRFKPYLITSDEMKGHQEFHVRATNYVLKKNGEQRSQMKKFYQKKTFNPILLGRTQECVKRKKTLGQTERH